MVVNDKRWFCGMDPECFMAVVLATGSIARMDE